MSGTRSRTHLEGPQADADPDAPLETRGDTGGTHAGARSDAVLGSPRPILRPPTGDAIGETRPATGIYRQAAALLASGAVRVTDVSGDRVAAVVAGRTDTYLVTYGPAAGWCCTCPAAHHRRECSHLLAVELTTTPRREP